jgi:hypothetical protein
VLPEEHLWNIDSPRFDACELDHLGPLLGFFHDEFAEIGRGAGKRYAA